MLTGSHALGLATLSSDYDARRTALDAFINNVYRAPKCAQKRNSLYARLEASEAVQHGLAVIFALEGRVKPYPVALAHELRAYPLQTFDDWQRSATADRGDCRAGEPTRRCD